MVVANGWESQEAGQGLVQLVSLACVRIVLASVSVAPNHCFSFRVVIMRQKIRALGFTSFSSPNPQMQMGMFILLLTPSLSPLLPLPSLPTSPPLHLPSSLSLIPFLFPLSLGLFPTHFVLFCGVSSSVLCLVHINAYVRVSAHVCACISFLFLHLLP